jgi:hypothetical protein
MFLYTYPHVKRNIALQYVHCLFNRILLTSHHLMLVENYLIKLEKSRAQYLLSSLLWYSASRTVVQYLLEWPVSKLLPDICGYLA